MSRLLGELITIHGDPFVKFSRTIYMWRPDWCVPISSGQYATEERNSF